MKVGPELTRKVLEQATVTGTVNLPWSGADAVDGMTFDLPVPPSANLLWRIAGNRMVKSQAYRDWLKEVALIRRHVRPVKPPVTIELQLLGKVHEGRDGDNFVKPAIDATVLLGVIPSDNLKHVRGHSFNYYPEEEGEARLRVIVRRLLSR